MGSVILVRGNGIEPLFTASKAAVLPLDDPRSYLLREHNNPIESGQRFS